MVAILSAPTWNATADTLTFGMRRVASEAALKLRDGVANGALAPGRISRLQGDAVGTVLKDVVLYIDDSSMLTGSQQVCLCTPCALGALPRTLSPHSSILQKVSLEESSVLSVHVNTSAELWLQACCT